jgi:hypothetical protein
MVGPEGRLFVSGSQLGQVTLMKQTVLRTIVAALISLISGSVWGCALPIRQEQETLQDHLVQGAMRERDAAYERLAKAITAYCEAKHATLEARYGCVLDRRLEWLRLRQTHQEEPDGLISTGSSRVNNDGDDQTSSLIKCDRASAHMICMDRHSALAENREKRSGTP